MSKSSRPLLWGEVIEISEWMTSPSDMRDLGSPLPCEVPHLAFTDWLLRTSHPPTPLKKCHLHARDEGGMLPKLRFKEAKSAFMGNYANLCSKIGVEKPFHLKTVAKLPSLIGNLFQVGLCLLSSPTLTDRSYLLQPRGY